MPKHSKDHGKDWWDSFWKEQGQHFGSPRDELLQRSLSHLLNQDKSIIDVASGNGRYAIPFAKNGADVTAVDNSASSCKLIQKTARSLSLSIKIEQLDVFDDEFLKLKNSPFRVVFCSGLIEEIDQKHQSEAVKILQKLTAPGGLLILKYCLEIEKRGKTVPENSIPPLFKNTTWRIELLETDPSLRNSIKSSSLPFSNDVRTETIIATKENYHAN